MTLSLQTVGSDSELLKPAALTKSIENKNAKNAGMTDDTLFARLLNEKKTTANEKRVEKEKKPLPGKAGKENTSYQGCKEASGSDTEEHTDPAIIEKTSSRNAFIIINASVEPSGSPDVAKMDPALSCVEDNYSGKPLADRTGRSRLASIMHDAVSREGGQVSELKTGEIPEPVFLSVHHDSAMNDKSVEGQDYSKEVSEEWTQNNTVISKETIAIIDVKMTSPNNEIDGPPDTIIKKDALRQEQHSADHSGTKIPQNGKSLFINDALQAGVEEEVPLEKRQNPEEVVVERVSDILRKNSNEEGTAAKAASQIKTVAVSYHDEAPPTFTPGESAFSPADTTKEKLAAAGGELNTAGTAPRADSEMQQMMPAGGSRVVAAKEAPAFYGHTTEPESDVIKTAASKGKISEKMTGPTVMEPLSMLSSFSDKMMVKTDNVTGLNAQSIIDQIADARQDTGKDLSRIKITLNPPNLGTVDLEVTVRQNRVAVVMIADHSGVQQVLQSHAEDIKSAFQRQDMKIDSFQVFLQNNPDGNQQQTSQWATTHDDGRQRHLYHETAENSPETLFEPADHSVQWSSGLVSIFA